jgi:hypothetical protein
MSVSCVQFMHLIWYWTNYTGWTIGVLGFDSRRELGIFLFTTAFRTALRPTQPPIQGVSGALSLGIKRPGREADHSPPCRAEVKEFMELYLHSPIRLRGAVLSLKRAQGQLYLYLSLPVRTARMMMMMMMTTTTTRQRWRWYKIIERLTGLLHRKMNRG